MELRTVFFIKVNSMALPGFSKDVVVGVAVFIFDYVPTDPNANIITIHKMNFLVKKNKTFSQTT